eukprot:982252-Prymnesium_polylepis.1
MAPAASTAGATSRRRSASGSGMRRVTTKSAATRHAATSPMPPPRCRAHRATRLGGCWASRARRLLLRQRGVDAAAAHAQDAAPLRAAQQ